MKMNKLLALLLVLCMVVSMVACAPKQNADETKPSTPVTQDDEEEEVSRKRTVSHGDEIDLDFIHELDDETEEDDSQSEDASESSGSQKKAVRQNMLVYEITLDELLELVD